MAAAQRVLNSFSIFTGNTTKSNMTEFKESLAKILEVDTVNESDVLKDFDEWDSLTSLSIIAMIDSQYNINISAEKLVSFDTVGDLIAYIAEEKNKNK
jgi:acyl carrier protein